MSCRLAQAAWLALLLPAIALAGLITQSGPRLFVSGGESGEWADTYVTDVANIGTALMTDGQTVGIEIGSTFTGLGQSLTPGNGATMEIVSGGSFDGAENAVKIFPPTNCIGGPCDDDHNAEYAGFATGLDVWNDAAHDIKQINIRVLVYYGPRYYDLAPPAKSWGIQVQTVLSTSGGDGNNRIGTFDYRDPGYTNWKYPYQIIEGVQTFCNPREGSFIEDCPAANKLIEIRGSANHAASPPQTGGEWVCFEQVIDVSQSRGNADGLHRLLISTRDGVVSDRELTAPLSINVDWNFTPQYVYLFEGFGFYFNRAGTADADNYIMFSHPTLAVNMANSSTLIGCDNIPGWNL